MMRWYNPKLQMSLQLRYTNFLNYEYEMYGYILQQQINPLFFSTKRRRQNIVLTQNH